MKAGRLPYKVDGAAARLAPGPHRSFASGPGAVGREGVAGHAVWASGAGIWTVDLLADFWAHDAVGIDWLTGFLCDQAMTDWFDLMANPPEPEEEEEELYARASMNTLESTVEVQ